ncbi:non-ribosomal peptide synthetase [Nocardia otitidiscaviarum]|uniref:Putative non-ribosomal peptide synthetase n=1 Tax=Nocardia otitidiscaviarum TaxID=1823 RepID=A0A060Q334_9NOCA|nr:non-ribosomal peptide synthetase [Nocardia otitidiscaviarum]BAO99104.1 putative non-ribosomal peptide synthetase [Nocardia otitidiscaviarum]
MARADGDVELPRSAAATPRVAPPDLPLSVAQLRWWVAQQLYPEVPNTVAMYLELRGPLREQRLRECAARAAWELQSPHVRFRIVDGHPRQFLDPDAFAPMGYEDLTTDADPVVVARERMERDHTAPLDLQTDALTVATLLRVQPDTHLLYLRSHHIVLDGIGAAVLLRRTVELYAAADDAEDVSAPSAHAPHGPLTIAELLEAERSYADSPRARADREYWSEQVAGLGEPVRLAGRAATRPRPPHRVAATLPSSTADRLTVFREGGYTFPELAIAAFACYLAAMTGSDQVLLSLPVAARPTAALRRSAGSVSNVVPLRIGDFRDATVAEAVERVRARLVGALRHQRYRYEDIQRDRGENHTLRGGFGPVVNMLGATEPLRMGALTAHVHLLALGPVEDLLVNGYQLGPDDRSITVGMQGNPELYSADDLAAHHRGFLEYLDRFLTDPERPVRSLDPEPMLPPPEAIRADRLLPDLLRAGLIDDEAEGDAVPGAAASGDARGAEDVRGSVGGGERGPAGGGEDVRGSVGGGEGERGPAGGGGYGRSLVSGAVALGPVGDDRDARGFLGAEGAACVPADGAGEMPGRAGGTAAHEARSPRCDRVAVEDGDRAWTYRELDRLSSCWARELIESGAGPGTVVVVAIPRSAESVLALWAVAKTGAAFAPVDPNDPARRLATVVADSGARQGLTVASARDGLPSGPDWLVLDDSDTVARVRRRSGAPVTDADRIRPLRRDHPAYLIYTSGTTGTPKGVVVTHRGLGPLTDHIVEHYGVERDSRVLHAHAPSFDAHLLELLAAFAAGARLVIEPPAVVAGADLAALLHRAAITHFLTTPAVLATITPEQVPLLRVAVVGGEACPAELVRRWGPALRLFNGYGPTETTVMATQSGALTADGPVPIGPPLPGVRALILDQRVRPAPPCGHGELYLGGPGVAQGYLGRPGATAERFVADPFGDGHRVYRTGDLVRVAADGALEFLGRADDQLSVRGRRAEPAEVAAALTALPDIAQAAVTAHDGPGGIRLIGYIVAAPGLRLDHADILGRLRELLPAALIPAQLVELDELPVTAHGKVDRSALPPPPTPQRPYRTPESESQRLVAERFAAITGAERVGLDDDFFELGGDSLLGVALSADLAAATGLPVTVRWLYTAPTVRELAARLDEHEGGTATDDALGAVLTLRRGGTRPPLFCVHSAVPLAWCYSGLARQLPDRPVYGLQALTLAGEPRAGATVDELADGYAAEIVRVSPNGPYHLLGWSLGGQIAHAVAVRLRARGADVATLAMLDSIDFPDDMPPPPAPRMRDLLTHLLGDEPEAADELPDLTAAEAAAELASAAASFGTGLTADQLTRLHRGYVDGVRLSHGYRPGVFDGDLLYFSATRGMTAGLDARMWRPHVTGALVEHPVDATHAQLCNADVVAAIGPILAAHLDGADSR